MDLLYLRYNCVNFYRNICITDFKKVFLPPPPSSWAAPPWIASRLILNRIKSIFNSCSCNHNGLCPGNFFVVVVFSRVEQWIKHSWRQNILVIGKGSWSSIWEWCTHEFYSRLFFRVWQLDIKVVSHFCLMIPLQLTKVSNVTKFVAQISLFSHVKVIKLN